MGSRAPGAGPPGVAAAANGSQTPEPHRLPGWGRCPPAKGPPSPAPRAGWPPNPDWPHRHRRCAPESSKGPGEAASIPDAACWATPRRHPRSSKGHWRPRHPLRGLEAGAAGARLARRWREAPQESRGVQFLRARSCDIRRQVLFRCGAVETVGETFHRCLCPCASLHFSEVREGMGLA